MNDHTFTLVVRTDHMPTLTQLNAALLELGFSDKADISVAKTERRVMETYDYLKEVKKGGG